jgi:hypothetical protein
MTLGPRRQIQNFDDGGILPEDEEKQFGFGTAFLELCYGRIRQHRAAHFGEFDDQHLMRRGDNFFLLHERRQPAHLCKNPARGNADVAVQKSERVYLHRSILRVFGMNVYSNGQLISTQEAGLCRERPPFGPRSQAIHPCCYCRRRLTI